MVGQTAAIAAVLANWYVLSQRLDKLALGAASYERRGGEVQLAQPTRGRPSLVQIHKNKSIKKKWREEGREDASVWREEREEREAVRRAASLQALTHSFSFKCPTGIPKVDCPDSGLTVLQSMESVAAVKDDHGPAHAKADKNHSPICLRIPSCHLHWFK